MNDESLTYPTKLYSWFDVESVLFLDRSIRPEEILQIDVYSYKVDILLADENDKDKVYEYLKTVFNTRFDEENKEIILDTLSGEKRRLSVSFEIVEASKKTIEQLYKRKKRTVPSFEKMGIVSFDPDTIPKPFEAPPIVVFYSYKGGVGRTLHMVDLLKVLTERGQSALIIDADLEAPGLTWWARADNVKPDISYIDFLSLLHTDETDGFKYAIDLASFHLSSSPWEMKTEQKKTQHYFLPTFRGEIQSIIMPIKPQHVIDSPGYEWKLLEAFHSLGKALNVDVILIDLRAGISELSSPYLLDPRVLKCIVTSTSSQSLMGTELITKLLLNVYKNIKDKITNEDGSDKEGYYVKPVYILSMIPRDLDTKSIVSVLYKMITFFVKREEDVEEVIAEESLIETYFASELAHLGGLQDAFDKLPRDIDRKMSDFYELFLRPIEKRPATTGKAAANKKKDINTLMEKAHKLIYAESGHIEELMPIPALKHIARQFRVSLPAIVVIGAKGAGKTFVFLNLCHYKRCIHFIKAIEDKDASDDNSPIFYPLLGSKNLAEESKKHVNDLQDCISKVLPNHKVIDFPYVRSTIKKELESNNGEPDWEKKWFSIFAMALGIEYVDYSSFKKSNMPKMKVIFIIDGLEDTFQELHKEENQQKALRALLQDIPERLKNDPNPPFGLIVFIRQDMANSSIRQNFKQFENLYQNYMLTWNYEEALRLITWLVSRLAKIDKWIDLHDKTTDIYALSIEGLKKTLTKLWGYKLGTASSHEANTARWVMGALSNFNGELQARDIIRFIYYSSKNAASSPGLISYQDRLIPPESIKKSIQRCSEDKIEEVKQEIPVFVNFHNAIRQMSEDNRVIPFDPHKLSMDTEDITLLEAIGVIREVKGEGYYVPEIYRYGLGLNYKSGARPRVLALQRRFLP
ncbi:MAG: hypothetical protein HQL03_10365 [Nitrospirae bacterium]|nr:hypothetical protein [Nitrospirota bacterium]MBF0591509.1 hypothetical protein [Nitrospirota bacterium]